MTLATLSSNKATKRRVLYEISCRLTAGHKAYLSGDEGIFDNLSVFQEKCLNLDLFVLLIHLQGVSVTVENSG